MDYIFSNQELPDNWHGRATVVAGNGIFGVRHTPWFYLAVYNMVKKTFPGLPEIKEDLKVFLPRIKKDDAGWQETLAFFKWAYDTYKSESMCYIAYSPDEKKYLFIAPEQEVPRNGLKVTYGDCPDLPAGYRLVGTTHSHANIAAFHSGGDIADQKKQNGVHITVGDLGKETFSFDAEFWVDGNSWKLTWFATECADAFPDEWRSKIKVVDSAPVVVAAQSTTALPAVTITDKIKIPDDIIVRTIVTYSNGCATSKDALASLVSGLNEFTARIGDDVVVGRTAKGIKINVRYKGTTYSTVLSNRENDAIVEWLYKQLSKYQDLFVSTGQQEKKS